MKDAATDVAWEFTGTSRVSSDMGRPFFVDLTDDAGDDVGRHKKSSYTAYTPAREAPMPEGAPPFPVGSPPPPVNGDQAGAVRPSPPPLSKSSYAAYQPAETRVAPPRRGAAPSPAKAKARRGEEDWAPRLEGVTILRELGRGGFGTVWLGWQGNREVAVKGFGQTPIHVVRREASITTFFSQFQTYFLWVGGWFWDERMPPSGEDRASYLIAELAVGDLHRDVVQKSFEEVPLRTRLMYVGQALEALSIMATHGFVHRDIKPDNLLLVRDGDKFRVKIADFGLSCVADNRVQDYDAALGRVGDDMRGVIPYIAPESFDMKLTPAADVYSMSLVMYQLLFQDLPPLLNAAHSIFVGPEENRVAEVVAMCKGFSFDRDGYFATLVEASRVAGNEKLQSILMLMMRMQTLWDTHRIDAKSAAQTLWNIVSTGTDEEWARIEAIVRKAKEEAFQMCRREANI